MSRAGNLASWLKPQTCSDTLGLGVLKWPQPDSHPVMVINSSSGIKKKKKEEEEEKSRGRRQTDRQTGDQSCWLKFDTKKEAQHEHRQAANMRASVFTQHARGAGL